MKCFTRFITLLDGYLVHSAPLIGPFFINDSDSELCFEGEKHESYNSEKLHAPLDRITFPYFIEQDGVASGDSLYKCSAGIRF
jgi:hypothetical protein